MSKLTNNKNSRYWRERRRIQFERNKRNYEIDKLAKGLEVEGNKVYYNGKRISEKEFNKKFSEMKDRYFNNYYNL